MHSFMLIYMSVCIDVYIYIGLHMCMYVLMYILLYTCIYNYISICWSALAVRFWPRIRARFGENPIYVKVFVSRFFTCRILLFLKIQSRDCLTVFVKNAGF